MISWFYVWLPRFCGCHCRDDRSFHYHGRRFPVCARCTGELVGILAAALCYPWVRVSALWAAVLMIPMILDGGIQALSSYKSTNTRRFATGLPVWLRIADAVLFYHSLCIPVGGADW